MGISPLPRKVEWTERDGKTKFKGKVVDEVYVDEEFDWGDYRKMIQLIETENGEKIIRFAYYIKNHGAPEKEFAFGSQNTLVLKQENARKLFEEARKKGFF